MAISLRIYLALTLFCTAQGLVMAEISHAVISMDLQWKKPSVYVCVNIYIYIQYFYMYYIDIYKSP